jgi:hypothetical protein
VEPELPLDFREASRPHAALFVFIWPLLIAVFYVAVSGALFFLP